MRSELVTVGLRVRAKRGATPIGLRSLPVEAEGPGTVVSITETFGGLGPRCDVNVDHDGFRWSWRPDDLELAPSSMQPADCDAICIEEDAEGLVIAFHRNLPVEGVGANLREALANYYEAFAVQFRALVVDSSEEDLSPAALQARCEFLRVRLTIRAHMI